MRPASLPKADRYEHGTRARYVTGCRCDDCKGANRVAYHARQEKLLELVREIEPGPPDGAVAKTFGTKAGLRTSMRPRCPGNPRVGSCPRESALRADSVGGICARCRETLLWNGLVPADRVRRHLAKLSKAGVGTKAVAAACDVSRTILVAIQQGRRKRIRATSEEKILGVTVGAAADGAQIDAGPTWKILDALLEAGWTRTELARRLGSEAATPALQIRRDRVLARTALAVIRLGRELAGETPPSRVMVAERGWSEPGAGGLQKHLSCRGAGCEFCRGEGWRRSPRTDSRSAQASTACG